MDGDLKAALMERLEPVIKEMCGKKHHSYRDDIDEVQFAPDPIPHSAQTTRKADYHEEDPAEKERRIKQKVAQSERGEGEFAKNPYEDFQKWWAQASERERHLWKKKERQRKAKEEFGKWGKKGNDQKTVPDMKKTVAGEGFPDVVKEKGE